MKKVFIVHGFKAKPNGNWKPWLLEKLNGMGIYACVLPMRSPDAPKCDEWIYEIKRQVEVNPNDEIFLVGHSLGVRAILRCLEELNKPIAGAVLISGRVDESPNMEVASFGGRDFDFKKIKQNCPKFAILHGDDDAFVPVENAHELGRELGVKPLIIKDGGHFDRDAGYLTFPQCLNEIAQLMKSDEGKS